MLRAKVFLDDVPFVGINFEDGRINRYVLLECAGEPKVFENRRNLLYYLDKILSLIDDRSPGTMGTIRIEIDNRKVE